MKKTCLTAICLAAILLTALCLSSCSSAELKKRTEAAEAYLKELPAKTGVDDSFSITGKSYSKSSGESVFTVSSRTFGDIFTVYINRDGQICDSYFNLSLQKEAKETVLPLLRQVTGEAGLEADISVMTYYSQPALSARVFKDLKEMYAAAGSQAMLRITLHPASFKNSLSEEAKKSLIRTLQSEGLYCTLYPEGDDFIWYEILQNGVWETRRTGADGGKMLDRKEYPLN